jgi:hypothetical protein
MSERVLDAGRVEQGGKSAMKQGLFVSHVPLLVCNARAMDFD